VFIAQVRVFGAIAELVTEGSGGSGLSSRPDDLDSIGQLYIEDNFRQLVFANFFQQPGRRRRAPVAGVAAGVGEVIAAHAVMLLEIGSMAQAALLAAHVDLELVIGGGVVAAIAGIGDTAIQDVADGRLHLRNCIQRVPS